MRTPKIILMSLAVALLYVSSATVARADSVAFSWTISGPITNPPSGGFIATGPEGLPHHQKCGRSEQIGHYRTLFERLIENREGLRAQPVEKAQAIAVNRPCARTIQTEHNSATAPFAPNNIILKMNQYLVALIPQKLLCYVRCRPPESDRASLHLC